VFDEQERIYHETQSSVRALNETHERESRIKLELSSMIGLISMRLGMDMEG